MKSVKPMDSAKPVKSMKSLKFISVLLPLIMVLVLSFSAASADSGVRSSEMKYASAAKSLETVEWLNGPTSLRQSISGSKISLSWSADSSGEQDGYVIHELSRYSYLPAWLPYGLYEQRPDGYYYVPERIVKTLSGTSCVIDMGTDPGYHYYRVSSYWFDPDYCISRYGLFVAQYNSGSARISAPADLEASQTASKKVKLTWNASSGAAGYEIYRAKGNGSFVKYASTKKTSFVDSKASNGSVFRYYVKATNGTSSAASETVTACPMAKPSSVKASVSRAQVTVSWKKVSGADSYRVYQKGPNDGSFSLVKKVNGKSAKITVSSSGTYKFCVIPERNGFKGLRSAEVSVKIKSSAFKTTYRAILIAQTYPGNGASTLMSPQRDVQSVERALRGLSGTKYSEIKSVSNKTASGILSAVKAMFAKADDNDVTVFYYSGHGAEDGSLEGVDWNGVSPRALRSALDNYRGRKVILVDACYSGAMISNSGAPVSNSGALLSSAARGSVTSSPSSFSGAFIRAFTDYESNSSNDLASKGYYVLTACRSDQLATELIDYEYSFSVFSESFCYGLGFSETEFQALSSLNADVNGDNRVTLAEAHSFIVNRVRYWKQVAPDAGIDMDVQVYPYNCSEVFFAR